PAMRRRRCRRGSWTIPVPMQRGG
ncbi:hypothetical protein XPN_1698, partial [Xanthomonas arboricola pv. pruni MAFF 301427]